MHLPFYPEFFHTLWLRLISTKIGAFQKWIISGDVKGSTLPTRGNVTGWGGDP